MAEELHGVLRIVFIWLGQLIGFFEFMWYYEF